MFAGGVESAVGVSMGPGDAVGFGCAGSGENLVYTFLGKVTAENTILALAWFTMI